MYILWYSPPPSELPVPGVQLILTSSTGTGEDSCLNVGFSDDSNSLTCVAGVVSNLVGLPSITLMREGSPLHGPVSDTMLTYTLPSKTAGDITCRVCIDVPEAGIEAHCSNRTISFSNIGGCTCTCTCVIYNYLHNLSTVPGQITPVRTTDNVSEIIIDWSRSDSVSADIVRYIVDVREYSSAGTGKVQMSSITGYPLELPSMPLQHTVKSLSKTPSFLSTSISVGIV